MTRYILSLALAAILLSLPARAAQLVMFESEYCYWCERWNAEIGKYYHRTAEGRIAPLRRVDMGAPRPSDLESIRGIVMTPTFLVIDRGREIGRIVGYPDKIGFWTMLSGILGTR